VGLSRGDAVGFHVPGHIGILFQVPRLIDLNREWQVALEITILYEIVSTGEDNSIAHGCRDIVILSEILALIHVDSGQN